jgi:hypothetical protein
MGQTGEGRRAIARPNTSSTSDTRHGSRRSGDPAMLTTPIASL